MKSLRVRPRSRSLDSTDSPKRAKLETTENASEDKNPDRNEGGNKGKRKDKEKYKGKGRVKDEPIDVDVDSAEGEEVEDEGNGCSICLQPFEDRTVLPVCSHDFCFECILVWTEQSRRCPLCNQSIGDYLIHNIRSKYDYRKFYLPPLRGKSPPPLRSVAGSSNPLHGIRRRRRQERRWGRREIEEQDRLERSIEKRKWVYRAGVYAKHVASNTYTKYRPYPTPAQFATSQELITRTTIFLRRELQVWEGLDVEFLTTFTISIMKSLDIRSEGAIKLLAEFLDLDDESGERRNAQHFAHEVYTYVRSPYRDLFVYDTVVQYDEPPNDPAPSEDASRRFRWNERDEQHAHPLVVGEYDRDRREPIASASVAAGNTSSRRPGERSRTQTPSPRRGRAAKVETPRRDDKGKYREGSDDDGTAESDVSWSPSGRSYPSARARERIVRESRESPPRRRGRGERGFVFEDEDLAGERREQERKGAEHGTAPERAIDVDVDMGDATSESRRTTLDSTRNEGHHTHEDENDMRYTRQGRPSPDMRYGKGKGKDTGYDTPRTSRRTRHVSRNNDDYDYERDYDSKSGRYNHDKRIEPDLRRSRRSQERTVEGKGEDTPSRETRSRRGWSSSRGGEDGCDSAHGGRHKSSKARPRGDDSGGRRRRSSSREDDGAGTHKRYRTDVALDSHRRSGTRSRSRGERNSGGETSGATARNEGAPSRRRSGGDEEGSYSVRDARGEDEIGRAVRGGEGYYDAGRERSRIADENGRRTNYRRKSTVPQDRPHAHEARGLFSDTYSRASKVDVDADEEERKGVESGLSIQVKHGSENSRFVAETEGSGHSHTASPSGAISYHSDKRHPTSKPDADSDQNEHGDPHRGRRIGTEAAKTIGRGTIYDLRASEAIDGKVLAGPEERRGLAGIHVDETGRLRTTDGKYSRISMDGIRPDSANNVPMPRPADGREPIIDSNNGSTSELRIFGMAGGRNAPSKTDSASSSRRPPDGLTGPGKGTMSTASTCAPTISGALSGEGTSAPGPSSDHVPRFPKKRTLRDSIQAHLQTTSSSGSVRRNVSERGKLADRKVGARESIVGDLQSMEENDHRGASVDSVKVNDAPSLLARLSNPNPTPSGSVSHSDASGNAESISPSSNTVLRAGSNSPSGKVEGGSTNCVGFNTFSEIHTTRMYSEARDILDPKEAQFQQMERFTVNGHRRTGRDAIQANTQSRLTLPRNVDERASRTRNCGTHTFSYEQPNSSSTELGGRSSTAEVEEVSGVASRGRVSLLLTGHLGSFGRSEDSSSLHNEHDESSSSVDGVDGSGPRVMEGICPPKPAARHFSTASTHDCAASAQVEDKSDISREPQVQRDRCASVSLLLGPGTGKGEIPRESGISNHVVSHVGDPPQSSMSDFPIQQEAPSKSVIEANSTSHKTASANGLDMRARLLERLQMEKARSDSLRTPAPDAEAALNRGRRPLSGSTMTDNSEDDFAPHATSVDDRISSRFDNTRCRSRPLDTSGNGPGPDTASTTNGTAETEANALEARLRARAQLRVRLAAEKRAVGNVSRPDGT